MLVPHGMQRNTRILHLLHNILKAEINLKLHILRNIQITAHLLQSLHPLSILLVPATTNQNQVRNTSRVLQFRNESVKSLDLKSVILFRPELRYGQETRFAVVRFQRNVVEFRHVTRGVDGESAFGFLPKLKYVISGP